MVVLMIYVSVRLTDRSYGGIGSENGAKLTPWGGKANRSGNGALNSATTAADSPGLDWDFIALDTGIGGEDVDGGGEGVYL